MTAENHPLLSELLANQRFLEQIALRLTGDRGSADDLVQETWLEAIERPPRHDANMSGWLQRVLRRLHYRRKQREARRRTIERDSVRGMHEPSADERAEAAEMARRVADMMRQLEEPYRSVVLLRLYEDRTPTQIAAQLGRPVNTVSSQLARGLAHLRGELDRQHGGERSRWTRALLPILWDASRRTQEEGEPIGTTRTGSARRLPLSAQLLLATGLTAVLVTVLVSLWPTAPEGPPLTDRSPAAEAAGLPSAELAAAPAQREARVAAAPPAPPPAGVETPPPDEPWIDYEVVSSAGAPLEGVSLYASSPSVDRAPGDLMSEEGGGLFMIWRPVARTDAQGRARIVVSESWTGPGNDGRTYVGLVASKPGFVRSPVHYVLCPPRLDAPLRVTLASPALSFRGRVTDAEGVPVRAMALVGPEDRVWIPRGPVNVSERTMGRFTDTRGAFQLDDLAPVDQRLILRANEFLPLVQPVDASAPAIEHTFVLQRGATLYGFVCMEGGEPAAGAEIIVRYSLPRIRPVMQGVYSRPDGTFELGGLAPPLVHVLARVENDHELWDSAFLTVSGSEVEWLPELARRPHLRLKIVTDDGEPLAGAAVKLYCEPRGTWSVDLSADGEGRLKIRGLPQTSYQADVYRSMDELQQGSPACAARKDIVSGEQENVLVVPRARLADAYVTGRIQAGADVRLPETKVYLRPLESQISTATRVDPDGRFSSGPIAPQVYRVTLFVEGRGALPMGEFGARANETHDFGDFVVPALATLNVDWRWPGEESQYSYSLEQLVKEGSEVKRWSFCTGEGRPPGAMQVLPGRLEWSVSRQGEQVDLREFEVGPSSSFPLLTGVQEATR